MNAGSPADAKPAGLRRSLRPIAAAALLLPIAAVGWLADRLSKTAALDSLEPGVVVPVIGDFLRFVLVFNPGAAFGMGEDFTWVFTLALAAVTITIIVLLVRRVRSRLWAVVLGTLLGGVLGNLTDRLTQPPGFPVGHVIDFISTPWMMPAIYNVADMLIVTSMVAVALLVLLGVQMDGSRAAENAENDAGTLLGAGDETPPDGGVAGPFGAEFPVASADEGVPADERGLPPLDEQQQREVERQANRAADELDRGER